LPTPAPCRRSALNADLSAGGVLEIHVVVGPWECAAGSNALAAPNFWLLAIPRGALPSKALSVVIDDRPPLINLRSGYLSTWTTTVDLRGPSENSGGAIGVAELQTNIDDARRDAYARGLQANRILEFGLFRWPSGAAMCSAPTDSPAGEVWGSFLVVADYHSAMEFRAAAGATVFCRSRSL
jgi:hypothetical protein